jgi:hypothetical protein
VIEVLEYIEDAGESKVVESIVAVLQFLSPPPLIPAFPEELQGGNRR